MGRCRLALTFLRDHGRKTTAWLPLTTPHRRVGVLAFGSRSADPYTDDVLAFMEQIASIVAIAVENGINREQAQHYEVELREERDRLQFMLDVNNLMVSRLDYRGLLEAICETVQRIVEADHIGVALWDEESGELRPDVIYNKARGFTTPGGSLALDASAGGVTFQRGVPALYRRSDLEGLGWDGAAVMKAAGVESMCCVPLVTRKGKLGTLHVGSANPDAFSDGDVALLGHASAQIAIAVENARAYEQVTTLNSQLTDEKQYLEQELQREFGDIIGASPAVQRVLRPSKRWRPTDSTVLILGETGTGKELIARAIHNLSPRAGRTFVRTSVAALPATLLESELFGHEKGAFTGADREPRRTHRAREPRHAVPRRGRRHPGRDAAEAAARAPGARVRAARQREDPARRRAHRRGHEPRSRAHGRGGLVPERSLLSPQRVSRSRCRRCATGPRTSRRWRGISSRSVRAAWAETVPAIPGRRDAGAAAMEVAREHPRAAERDRTGRDPDDRPEPRIAVPGSEAKGAAAVAGSNAAATLVDAERDAILRALRDAAGVIAGPKGAAARLGLRRTTLHSKMRKLGIQRPSF